MDKPIALFDSIEDENELKFFLNQYKRQLSSSRRNMIKYLGNEWCECENDWSMPRPA